MIEIFKSLDVGIQQTLIIAPCIAITIIICTYYISAYTDFFDKNGDKL